MGKFGSQEGRSNLLDSTPSYDNIQHASNRPEWSGGSPLYQGFDGFDGFDRFEGFNGFDARGWVDGQSLPTHPVHLG